MVTVTLLTDSPESLNESLSIGAKLEVYRGLVNSGTISLEDVPDNYRATVKSFVELDNYMLEHDIPFLEDVPISYRENIEKTLKELN